MDNEDCKQVFQIPPDMMHLYERREEIAMYMKRGILRPKRRKDREGFRGSLREYLTVRKRKTDERQEEVKS